MVLWLAGYVKLGLFLGGGGGEGDGGGRDFYRKFHT